MRGAKDKGGSFALPPRKFIRRHSGGDAKHRPSDAQLRIGESRDSGLDAAHRPGMTAPNRWHFAALSYISPLRRAFAPLAPDPGSMTTPRKLHIKSYGCQMNVYDAQRMVDTLAP